MTIRLLARHDKYAANTIVTLDAATEAGLIAAKQATADLTGGVPYVAPPAAPNQLYPLQVAVDASGNSVGVVGFNGQSVSLGGGGPGSVAIAGIGDSLTYQNTYSTSPAVSTNNRSIGFLVWMMQLSDGAVYFDGSLNYGIGGQTSAQVYARSAANAADMKARGARFCTVLVGTNDLNDPSITEKQVVDNTAGICANLMAQGVTPIVIPILPRAYGSGAGVAITTDMQRTLQRWANGQRNYAKRTPGVMLYDPTIPLTDQSDALGYPVGRLTPSTTGYTMDGLHLTPRGSFQLGRGLLSLVKPFLPAYSPRVASQADLYDATFNPGGNRYTNPFMTGSVAQNSTGAAGVAATGLTIVRQTTAGTGTVTGSKGTRVIDGVTLPTQVCVTSGTGAAIELYRAYITLTGLTVGQLVDAEVALGVSNITAGALTTMQLIVNNGAQFLYGNRGETGMYQPDEGWTGTISIPQFTATNATALLILEWGIDGNVANATARVEISRIGFRSVAPA